MTDPLKHPPPPTDTARKIFAIILLVVGVLVLLTGSAGGLCIGILMVIDKGKDSQLSTFMLSAVMVLIVGGGILWAGIRLLIKK